MRNNQKQIDLQEIVDRNFTISLFNQLFDKVEYTMFPISANTDLTITATTKNNKYQYHVEVKNRYVMIDDFNDCFLEVEKYKHLKNDCKNHIPVYVAIYPADSTVCIWNLSKIDISKLQIKKIKMNEVTFNNSIKKIEKDVYLLPIQSSTKYNYNYAFHKQTA